MKLIQNIVVVVFSFFWGTTSYAVNGALAFDKAYTNSREPAYMTPSGTCPKPSLGIDTHWGTDVINGDYGRELVKYALDGTAAAYTESNLDNLTPKGRTDKPFFFSAIDHVWPLPDGSVLFAAEAADHNNYLYKFKNGNVGNNSVADDSTPAYGNKQAVLNMGERQVNGVVSSVPNIRALHHRSIVVATINCQTVLFYGEYNVSNDKRLALWKSTDMGDTWSIAFEWNVLVEQTFHIHGVVQNPYNGWIYILFGDYDSESAIVAWDGVSLSPTQQADNPSPAQMKNYPGWKSIAGSQRVRTGDLIFTPPTPAGTGKAVWIPDIDVLQATDDFTGGDIGKSKGVLYSQQANYDLTGLQSTGAVPNYTNGFPPILGTRSDRSGNIYWSSFRIANNVPPQPSKEIYLWRSADSGLTWTQDVKPPMYLDGVDDYTALPKDLYVNTDSAGTDFLSIIGTNLELNSTGQRIGSTAVYKSPVTSSTGAVANNDNYVTFATNLPRVQAVNVSVADGVGKNDLPTGVTGRTFARVPKSLKRISADTEGGGTGKGTIAVVFNADGSFRYTVSAKTTTASSEYWRDKLGTYQFSYTMTYNGVKTAQATVTIVFN